MKRFRKLIAALSLLVAGVGLWAENTPVTSPGASEVIRYGRIPVSYFNGLPSVEIPLCTAKCGEVELPVSLSYHASGIRVNQYPTSVGLGWNLNAAGCITRVINGLPDESTYEDSERSFIINGVPSNPGFYWYSQYLGDNWNTETNLQHMSYYDDEFSPDAQTAWNSIP